MANIYYTDVLFKPSEANPFNESGRYGGTWIVLKLLDDADYFLFTGGGQENVFQVTITKRCSDWKYRIMDFLEYETSGNKNIIAAVSRDDLDIAKKRV